MKVKVRKRPNSTTPIRGAIAPAEDITLLVALPALAERGCEALFPMCVAPVALGIANYETDTRRFAGLPSKTNGSLKQANANHRSGATRFAHARA